MRDFVIGIPATIAFTSTGVITNVFLEATPFQLASWVQPEFSLLLPLIRIEVKLGFNNIIIQRAQMNYAQGLKMIALDNKYTKDEMYLMGSLGATYSTGFYDRNAHGLATVSNNYTYDAFGPMDVNAMWLYNSYKQIYNVAVPPSVTTELALPLSMMNSFFAQDAFLPPGINYRIEIEWNPVVHNVAYNNPVPTTNNTTYANATALQVTYTGNYNLKYRSHILKAHIQSQINNEWITRPLLYQYDTYEYVEILGDGATITLLKDIAISQQRPTTLFFRVMPNLANNATTSVITLGTAGAGALGPSTSFANGTAPGFKIRNIFVYIGGRQNYYLRMDPVAAFDPMIGSSGYVNALVNSRCYTENNKFSLIYSTPNGFNFSQPYAININPGDFVKKGYISTDGGALVIRIQMDVVGITNGNNNVALPSTMKMVIYKKYPGKKKLY